MNIVKGLITKDLLQLKSYKKTLILYILIFFLTSLVQENTKDIGYMLIVMMILGFGMFAVASLNYDEQANANRYLLTLPITKKSIVFSKYIFVVMSNIIGFLFGILFSFLIIYMVAGKTPSMEKFISMGLGGLLGVSFIEAIQIPCIYKFGAEKGRIYMFIVVAFVTLLIGGVFFLGEKINIGLSLSSILSIVKNFFPLLIVLATTIIYFISYKISCKILENKDI